MMLKDPPELLTTITALDAFAKTVNDAWQIPLVEGHLLTQLALAVNARTIVEIGTSYGFSALNFARALRHTHGHLHTIDRDPKKFESSKSAFARAGVADLITNYLGDAAGILPNMPSGIDLAFIDADKPACQTYFDLLWPKVRPGGAVLTDNATTHATELAPYITGLRSRPDAYSTLLPVGNGVEWTVKLP
jgi:predicted O-methyltransferase YrrM